MGVAVLAALLAHPFALWSTRQLTRLGWLRDDAFFYAVIADNVADVGQLTFDGQMLTNGVQPMWQLVLVALRVVTSQSAVDLLPRLAFVGYCVAALVASLWVLRFTRSMTSLAVFVGLTFLNAGFERWVMTGLETPLFILTLTAFAWSLGHALEHRPSTTHAALLGVLAASCFLARVDHFMWVPLGTLVFVRHEGRLNVDRKGLLAYAVSSAALVIPYSIYNGVVHGGLVPISGVVKRFTMNRALPTTTDYLSSIEWHGLPHAFLQVVPHPHNAPFAVALVTFVGIFVPVVVWAVRRHRSLPRFALLLLVGLGVHVIALYVVHRELRPYTSYYFVGEVFAFAWLVAYGLGRWANDRRRKALASGGALIIALAALVADRVWAPPTTYWDTNLQMADTVRELPADASVGAYWPGVIAAFSERAVVPLDGIVGSREYFDRFVASGNELDRFFERSDPHLAIYLHEPLDEVMRATDAPHRDLWNRLGTTRLWEYRECAHSVEAEHRSAAYPGRAWYLLRFDRDDLARGCRRR